MTTTVAPPTSQISAATQWRRLSPRMLLVHPIIELSRALPALIGLFVAGSSNGGRGSIWSVVGALVVIALGILHWFTTRFRITSDQIQLRRGVVRRVTVSAPLERVRTVDVTAHLLHRALGLAKVAIGTGTSDRKGRAALVLDGLSATSAAALRAELLHRDEVPAATANTAVSDELIVGFDRAWIRYAPFTLSGAITSLAILGFGWRLVNEAHVRVVRLGPLRVIANELRRTAVGLDVAVVTAAVVTIIAVASTIGYLLAFWNFRLSRNDGGSLHVSRGLVTTRATSIDRRRLVGVEVSEPILLRAVHGARCIAIATGLRVGHGSERGGEVLLPPAPLRVAIDVTESVLGSAQPMTSALIRHPRAALRRRVVRATFPVLAFVAVVGIVVAATPLSRASWFASIALFVLVPALAVDRYRSLGHAIIGDYVVNRFGSLTRRRNAIARDAIIGWNFTASIFQRRARVTTLTMTTAAGRQGYKIVDADAIEAVAFANAATPGLLDQFSQ